MFFFWVLTNSFKFQKHLENMGLKKFDPFNISLLNYIGNIECQIFIHQSSLPFIHHLPNLLNLKRDPRVMFAEFSSSNEVIDKMSRVVFPRGGVVLLDLPVILSSNPGIIIFIIIFLAIVEFHKHFGVL